MDLTDAVENATRLAAFKGEDHVVGRIKNRPVEDWQIAHSGDQAGQADMMDPKLVVHPKGLDKKYFEEGIVKSVISFPADWPKYL